MGRIPDAGIQTVEDAEEPIALAAQETVETHTEGGCQRFRREPRRDGVGQLGTLDARGEQVDPVGFRRHDAIAGRQAQLTQV